MIAKEKLDQVFNKQEYVMATYPYLDSEDAVLEAMQEYAKMKCQELLEIVVDKARVENECYPIKPNSIEKVIHTEHNGSFFINKDSILNAVNLDEFIKY